MLKTKNLSRAIGIAALAIMFGAPAVYAQSSSSSMGEAGANTMNSAGKTDANREGKMSPSGQNETTSTEPIHQDSSSGSSGTAGTAGSSDTGASSGTSGTSGSSMGEAGANTMYSAG